MYAKLFHIYGPFSIHTYGLCIALGVMLFGWLINRDTRRVTLCTPTQLYNMLLTGIIVALIGGRMLYVILSWNELESWYAMCAFWDGGLVLLGSLWAIACCAPWYFYKQKIAGLAMLDVCTTYVPLLQAIARIGCFFAGCCHGSLSSSWLSVTYTDIYSMAPLYIPLHPAQLYSSALLFVLFLFLYGPARYICKYPGQLASIYVLLSSLERCFNEIFRDTHDQITNYAFLNINQLLALATSSVACIMWCFFSYKQYPYSNIGPSHESV